MPSIYVRLYAPPWRLYAHSALTPLVNYGTPCRASTCDFTLSPSMGVIEFVIKFYTHQSKDSFPFHPDTNISGRRCTFESLVAPASEGIRRSPRSIGRCALELSPVRSAVGDGNTIRARPYGRPIWGAKMLSQKSGFFHPVCKKAD